MRQPRLLKPFVLVFAFSALSSCSTEDRGVSSTTVDLQSRFSFINEQTDNYISVYGSKTIKEEQYNRAYADVKFVLDNMDGDIKKGMLDSNVKLLVVRNEQELENDIDFFVTLLPVEAVFTDNGGIDETLSSSSGVGVSTTKLELMYLSVYYSLLTNPSLSDEYAELQAAYSEATAEGIFTPGEAYQDGYIDEIHQHASDNNALKYGSYLFGLYALYHGNGSGMPGEFSITTKPQLQEANPLGFAFIESYYQLP